MEKGKLYGIYPGIVESTDEEAEDGKKLHRVRVRVFEIYDDDIPAESLPWAFYQLPLGSRPGEGMLCPVRKGDYVFVRFLYGDDRRPVITGSMHYCPEEKPGLPPELWEGEGVIEHKRTGDETTPGERKYPLHHAFEQHGINIEIYEEKAFVLTHRGSGTAVSIDKDGNIILHSEKNLWSSAIENQRIIIEGDRRMEVKGNLDSEINGEETRTIDGSLETKIGSSETRDISSERKTTVGSDETLDVGSNLTVTVGSNGDVSISGNCNIEVGGNCNVNAGGICSVKASLITLN